jgi:hypothetical protein
MLALHVPCSFARYKTRLTRALYRISKSGVVDIKKIVMRFHSPLFFTSPICCDSKSLVLKFLFFLL